MANKSLQKARAAYSKNQNTKYSFDKKGKRTEKKKKKKKTVGSHYEQVREKTQNTEKNRTESREKSAGVAKAVGSAAKKETTTLHKSSPTREVKSSPSTYKGTRSGAFTPVNSKGTQKRNAASTARTAGANVGKSIKTAVNPHKEDTAWTAARSVTRKKGESYGDYMRRKNQAVQDYNANSLKRKETKTKTGYTDEDRAKISTKAETELLSQYNDKSTRWKTFNDQWDEKGGLGDQFREIYGYEATDEEKKKYYKNYWRPDYDKNVKKLAKKQADDIAKEEAPDVLYSRELSRNEAAGLRELSKYTTKDKNGETLGNKALKGLGTLKYTTADLGKTKPDGTKVTKKDLGKVKTDKEGNIQYQKVAKRDYKGNIVKDKNGKPVMVDRNVAEEVGSLTAAGTNEGKFATGFMQGSSPVNVLHSGIGEYNNAAKKVLQNTTESHSYMGGYMAGFAAQFMASGVPFVERNLMAQAMERGVAEDAKGVMGKLLNKAIGGAEKNAGIKFAENRGLELALETPINFADAAKMSMDSDGKVNTKALAGYLALNSGLTVGMGGAMEGVGVAFTRSNAKEFSDLFGKSLTGNLSESEAKRLDALQIKLNKAGTDLAVARSNVAHKALYDKTVASVVFRETGSPEKALEAMSKSNSHTEKFAYAQAIRDKCLSDIDKLRTEKIKLLEEANAASPKEAIKLRKQAAIKQEQMDALSNIARGADRQFQISAKKNIRELNTLKGDLQRMSYKTGINFRVADSQTMKDIMISLGEKPKEGTFYRGYFYKNEKGELEVLINSDSPQAHEIIVGHELGHMIKDSSPEDFAELSTKVREFADKLGGFKDLEDEIKRSYPNATKPELQEELTCELVGRFIVGGDRTFIKTMAGDNPSIFKKMVNYIKGLFDNSTTKELKKEYGSLYKKMVNLADKIDANKVDARVRYSQTIQDNIFADTSKITPENVAPNGKVTKAADDAYVAAVESGDTETAQKFVDAVLEARGYTIDAYHGTADFGFTEFDREIMNNKDIGNLEYGAMMIFASSDWRVSKTYFNSSKVGVQDLKGAGKRVPNEYKLTNESVEMASYKLGDEIYDAYKIPYLYEDEIMRGYPVEGDIELGTVKKTGESKFTVSYSISKDEFSLRLFDNDTGDLVHSRIEKFKGGDLEDWIRDMSDLAESELIYMWRSNKLGRMAITNAGIYHAKLRMANPFVIDASGGRWSRLPVKDAIEAFPEKDREYLKKAVALRSEIDASGESADDFFKARPDKNEEYRALLGEASRDLDHDLSHITENGMRQIVNGEGEVEFKTRQLAELVYRNTDKDGVVIKNVYDKGGKQHVEGAGLSDVYILFDSNQFKVADAATYDDSGNLIPLSKRADESNPDIRFSKQEEKKIDFDINDLNNYKDAKTYDEFVDTNFDVLKENVDSFGRTPNGGNEMEQIWRVKRSNVLARNAKELSREDAVNVIRNNIKESHLAGWFRNGDSSYKPLVVEQVLNNDETLNAAWSLMYYHYKDITGSDISFKEFLDTPITLYRGNKGVGKVKDDIFTAFSLRENMAKYHAKNRPVNALEVRPRDTWGSFQTTNEAEVLVPEYYLGKDGNLRYSKSEEKKIEVGDLLGNGQEAGIRTPKGEVQGRQILNESNRKVGEEKGRRLGKGRGGSETLLVKPETRQKMSELGITDTKLRKADHAEFSEALERAREANPRGDYVDGKTVEELKEKGAKCFLSNDGLAGVCIEKDGNISGVFKHPDSNYTGALRDLIITARENGGTKMDCFGEYLADGYAECGFRVVNKIENNPKFSDIKDDVYTLVKTEETTDEVLDSIANGSRPSTDYDALPYYPISKYGDDAYDVALSARDREWTRQYDRQMDSDYDKAIKAGNDDEAQKIVDNYADMRLADSAIRDANNDLIHVQHATMKGGFDQFSTKRADPRGDSGAGIYFTSNFKDAEKNYSTKAGADNSIRIQRLADQLFHERLDTNAPELLTMDEARELAEKKLVGESQTFEVVADSKNPVIVGKSDYGAETDLMDGFFKDVDEYDEFESSWERDDFANEEDFEEAKREEWEEACAERINEIAYKVEDIAENWEDAREVITTTLWNHVYDRGLTFDELKAELNEASMGRDLLDYRDREVTNEIARAISEELGYDSVWDFSVWHKFPTMGLHEGDFHLILFRPEQAKLIDTVTRDEAGVVIPPSERFNVYEKQFRFSKQAVDNNKLDALNAELSNYEKALEKAITEEEKGLIESTIQNLRERITNLESSDAPKTKPKKTKKEALQDVKKTQAKLKKAEAEAVENDAVKAAKEKVDKYTKEIADLEQKLRKTRSKENIESIKGQIRGKKSARTKAENKLKAAESEAPKEPVKTPAETKKAPRDADFLEENIKFYEEKLNEAKASKDASAQRRVDAYEAKLDSLRGELGETKPKATPKAKPKQATPKPQKAKPAEQKTGKNTVTKGEAEPRDPKVIEAQIKLQEDKIKRTKAAMAHFGLKDNEAYINGLKNQNETLDSLKEELSRAKAKEGVSPSTKTKATTPAANKNSKAAKSNTAKTKKTATKESATANPKKSSSSKGKNAKAPAAPKQRTDTASVMKRAKNPTKNDVNLTVEKERDWIKKNYGGDSDLFKVLKDGINNGHFDKRKYASIEQASQQARAEIKKLGYEDARDMYLRTNPFEDPYLTVARAEELRKEVRRNPKYTGDESQLMQPIYEISNFSGNAQRALRELALSTPEGRVKTIEREVARLQKRYAKNLKGREIIVDKEKIKRLSTLEAGEERDALLQEINIDIWSQIPASLWEKMNEIRHCFMLFNARTHMRNVFGNLVFKEVRRISDGLEVAILNSKPVKEKIKAMGGEVDKVHVTRAEKNEFNQHLETEFNEVYRNSGSRNKLIEHGRPDGVPIVEWKPMRDIIANNYWLLEKEDLKFTLVPEFKKAYISWCKSRCDIPKGAKPEQVRKIIGDFMDGMSEKDRTAARQYALVQGEYATFRDACALSTWLTAKKQLLAGMKADTRLGTIGYRALDTVLEGALPFVKTPINIARRSLDYSPVGLIRGLTNIYKADNVNVFKASIHDICTGLTGTGITALGFYLASQGVVTIKTGSDKEGSGDAYIDRDMGFQDYSLKITPPFGNKEGKTWSWTLDWMAPTEMSLFSGAALQAQYEHGMERFEDEGIAAFFSGKEALNTFFAITSPLTDTSFMSSSKDTFTRFLERATRGAEDGESTDFAGALAQMITGDLPKNYVSGFEPQLMAQIAGLTDPIQRDTSSTARSEFVRGWDSAFKQLVSRMPWARKLLNPKDDRYGRVKKNEDNIIARFFEAMVLPSNVKEINKNSRDQELINIHNNMDKTSDDYKYYWFDMSGKPPLDLADGGRMSYRDMYEYSHRKRLVQTKMYDEMINSDSYKNMTWEMKAQEVVNSGDIANVYCDKKVYGANYAALALSQNEKEKERINTYRSLKGVDENDEAANEKYVNYYYRKERYINRAHSDGQDSYYLKGLSALMSGDKALLDAVDIDKSKVDAMRNYMNVTTKKVKGDKVERNKIMFKELTDGCCNIMSNLKDAGVETSSKGVKSASAGLCAYEGNPIPEDVYRAYGHNWNSAQAGGGLLIKYNTDGRYDIDKVAQMKVELKALYDTDGSGKVNKAEAINYIDNVLKIDNPDEAACVYEVLYNQGRYRNPYKSEIDDHLEWGENHDDDWGTATGGTGGRGGRRRGRRRGGWGHGGGGSGGSGTMPKTASGAFDGKVTDPFATSKTSKASNLNDAYRKKAKKLREQNRKTK